MNRGRKESAFRGCRRGWGERRHSLASRIGPNGAPPLPGFSCLRIGAAIFGDCLHSHPTTLQCSTGQEETREKGPEGWKNLPPRITFSCDKRYMIVVKGKGGVLISSFSLCKSDTECT